MSLQSTFWHKGQRDTIGSRVLWKTSPTVAAHGSTAGHITYSAFDFTLADTNGKVHSIAASTDLDLDAVVASHANNPTLTITDDRSSASRTERQDANAVVVASASFCNGIFTVDVDDNVRCYIGEIVTTAANAKYPVLDLDKECPFWAFEVPTAAFTFGVTAWATITTSFAIIGMP